MHALALAAMILAASDPAPATGTSRPLMILPIEGVQTDSLQRSAFLDAFRSEMTRDSLATQSRAKDAWLPGPRVANRFHVIDDGAGPDAWILRVVVGLPPVRGVSRMHVGRDASGHPELQMIKAGDAQRRASRGMNLAIVVRSAEDVREGTTPAAWRTGVTLPTPAATETGAFVSPAGVYPFPWSDAGRAAARLALEALHHRSRDLLENARLDLSGAIRAPSEP